MAHQHESSHRYIKCMHMYSKIAPLTLFILTGQTHMSPVSIIILPPSRWPEYKAVRLNALENDPTAFATTYQEDAMMPDQEWQDRLKNATGQKSYMLFAESEGKIIGMTGALLYQGQCVKHQATIVSVYVTPEYRGQGIAKKLMHGIIQCLQNDKKIVHVQLTVNINNTAAIKLYESFGFKKIGILEKLVKINDNFVDGYMMIKILDK